MKHIKACALIAIVLLSGRAVWAQTADEIIEKHLAAMGGREALQKLQSRTMTGTITVSTPVGELSGSIVLYARTPNKFRTLVNLDLASVGAGKVTVDRRFDGTSGFVLDSMTGDRELTAREIENAKNNLFPTPYLEYKGLGATIELMEKEKIGGKEMYVLKYTPKSGVSSKQFIDPESFLLRRTVSTITNPQTGEIEQTSEFDDYQDVDGIKTPFQVKMSNPAQSFEIRVTKVEHNTEIDEAMFSKPAPKN